MFEIDIKEIIKSRLQNNTAEEIQQSLIDEMYLSTKEKKRKGVVTFAFQNHNNIFNHVLYVGDTAQSNKFMLLSKYRLDEKDTNNIFVYSFKNEDVINPEVLSAISTISKLPFEKLAMLKAYRNSTSRMYMADSHEEFLTNPFLAYLVSFGTTAFTIRHKTKHSVGKISNIIENQLGGLPTTLPYLEEMKILNRIANNLIKLFTNNKEAPLYLGTDVSSFNEAEKRARADFFKDFSKKIIYIDIIFRKSFAISRYVIPYLINKVKLSSEVIDRFVEICNQHLLDNIHAKLVEEEISTDMLNPFIGKRLFECDEGLTRDDSNRYNYNYNENELFDNLNIVPPVERRPRRNEDRVALFLRDSYIEDITVTETPGEGDVVDQIPY